MTVTGRVTSELLWRATLIYSATFVEVKSAESRRATYRGRLAALETRLSALRLRERPSRVLQQGRQRS
jgi:hypothetical protein